MSIRNQITITCLCIFALPTLASAATMATETWDDAKAGTNGWTQNTTSATVVHLTDGGNPDGHIRSRRSGPFDIGALIDSDDSSDFTGNYAGINSASFDAIVLDGQVTDLWLRFRTGPAENGWRFPFFSEDDARGADWIHYSVDFNPAWSDGDASGAGWIQDDSAPAFATVMAAVDTAEVRFAAGTDTLLVGIDNFSLVPEPNCLALWLMASLAIVLRARKN